MSSYPPLLTRTACDSCHKKKVRCKVAANSDMCERCQRHNLKCHFSPPAKTGRPAHSTRSRRTRTAPASSLLRRYPSQTFDVHVPGHSFSMSPSPAPFAPVQPRTPMLDTAVSQGPVFYQEEYTYPVFESPMVLQPPQAFPPPTLNTNIFRESTPGLLTPISMDQGYDSAASPMTTMSSMSMPFIGILGPGDELHFEPESHSPPAPSASGVDQSLEVCTSSCFDLYGRLHISKNHGLDLNETLQMLSGIGSTLSSCTSPQGIDDSTRVENLLHATERVVQLLRPYFEVSPQSANIAQSLESSTLGFMVSIVSHAVEAYDAILHPPSIHSPAAPTRQSNRPATPPHTISPQALSISSSMPVSMGEFFGPSDVPQIPHPATASVSSTAAPPSTTFPFSPAALSISAPQSERLSVPNLMAPIIFTAGSSNPPVIAPAMSSGPLPDIDAWVGRFTSRDTDLKRWILANTMLYQIRALSHLERRIEICLSFCAPPQIAESLDQLSNRITHVKRSVKNMVQLLADEDR